MKNFIQRFIVSVPILKRIALFFLKTKYARKYKLIFGKNSYINDSIECEGRNFFSYDSSFVSSKIGYASYIGANTKIFKTEIGKYSSIGPNVRCIFGQHPTSKFVSTHPSFFSRLSQVGFTYTDVQLFDEHTEPLDESGKYSIQIGNDVWIGDGAAIMEGVRIGDGAIIAANALVVKDIPPYTIFGGVPAKLIRKRFSDEEIKFLLDFEWWNKDQEWIRNNAANFTDIDKFRKCFKDQ
ncbi:CatB-related O-acetyltransferase [Maribacter sp. 2308TA10-17]|uniref:CatB-related O-acetyltransferase n=1 Tax=Maribacter sp. 2308TA10-17 TaxID=3386276 RepID=UPI0039BD1AC9